MDPQTLKKCLEWEDEQVPLVRPQQQLVNVYSITYWPGDLWTCGLGLSLDL